MHVLPLACALVFASAADLSQLQSVYLLPMGGGLDQYLASRLTGEGVVRVVVNPRAAEAVLTDHIGARFERRLDEMFPPAAPEAPETKTVSDNKPDSAQTPESVGRISSFGRGQGNLFLVDPTTRRVLWSIYQRPRSSAPDDLDRAARRVVERLKRDLGRK